MKCQPLLRYFINHRTVWISGLENVSTVEETGNGVVICGFEFSLKFLRVFGPILKCLCYTPCGDNLERRKWIEESISRNCAETLEVLMLYNLPGKSYFSVTYVKVERLFFQWSIIPTYLCKIDIYFPNVEILRFDSWNELRDETLFINSLTKLNVLIFGKDLNIPFFHLKETYPKLEIKYHK